jgi:hypothetical protein
MTYRCLVLAILAASVAAGCDSSTPAQTPEQVKSFKGGPMPKDMLDKMPSGGGGDAAAKARAKAANGQ